MRRLIPFLLLLSLPAFAQDNGYQKRPPRDRNTSEPAAGAWVSGVFYNEVIPLPGIAASGPACSSEQTSACWNSCQAQVSGTTCQQMGSWCESVGSGSVNCHCQYFCPTSGGSSNKPKQLVVRPDDGWDDTGGV